MDYKNSLFVLVLIFFFACTNDKKTSQIIEIDFGEGPKDIYDLVYKNSTYVTSKSDSIIIYDSFCACGDYYPRYIIKSLPGGERYNGKYVYVYVGNKPFKEILDSASISRYYIVSGRLARCKNCRYLDKVDNEKDAYEVLMLVPDELKYLE